MRPRSQGVQPTETSARLLDPGLLWALQVFGLSRIRGIARGRARRHGGRYLRPTYCSGWWGEGLVLRVLVDHEENSCMRYMSWRYSRGEYHCGNRSKELHLRGLGKCGVSLTFLHG